MWKEILSEPSVLGIIIRPQASSSERINGVPELPPASCVTIRLTFGFPFCADCLLHRLFSGLSQIMLLKINCKDSYTVEEFRNGAMNINHLSCPFNK